MNLRRWRLGVVAAGVLGVVCPAIAHIACGGGDSGGQTSSNDSGSRTDAASSDAAVDGGADSSQSNAPATLLTDSTIWSSVATRNGCPLFEAKVTPDPFPARTWVSCGTGPWATGCQVSSIGLPIDTYIGDYPEQTSGTTFGGETYVQTSLAFKTTVLEHVVRLSDGATVAAARMDGAPQTCFFGGFPQDTPLLFNLFREQDSGATLDSFGVGPQAPGAGIAWDQHWISDNALVLEPFMFDAGHGYAFASGGISIATPDASAYTPIISGPAPQPDVTARGDLLVWGVQTGTGGVVAAYTLALGVQNLVTNVAGAEVQYPYYMSMSDDHIVWVLAKVNAEEVVDELKFQWTPLARKSSDVVLTNGPTLSRPVPAAETLATGGDYAAIESCADISGTDCVVNVVQLSTQKTWAIPHRPGTNVYRKTLAINDDELVMAEQDNVNDTLLRRIVRIKISQLDALTVP